MREGLLSSNIYTKRCDYGLFSSNRKKLDARKIIRLLKKYNCHENPFFMLRFEDMNHLLFKIFQRP